MDSKAEVAERVRAAVLAELEDLAAPKWRGRIRDHHRIIADLRLTGDDATAFALLAAKRAGVRVPAGQWSDVETVEQSIRLLLHYAQNPASADDVGPRRSLRSLPKRFGGGMRVVLILVAGVLGVAVVQALRDRNYWAVLEIGGLLMACVVGALWNLDLVRGDPPPWKRIKPKLKRRSQGKQR